MTARIAAVRISDEIAVSETEIEERFVRASGPGGQNVNKVSTAVELRVDIARSSLPAHVKQRLATLAGSQMHDGMLQIDSREHRTQAANRAAARGRLRQPLAQAAVRPRRRRKTKPTAGSSERRIASNNVKWGETRRARRDHGVSNHQPPTTIDLASRWRTPDDSCPW